MQKNLELPQYDRFVTIGVDVQQDFCPGGALAVEDGDQVIPPLNVLMDATRRAGGQVILTRDWHPTETPHFNDWPITTEAGVWPRHCVAGTDGADFAPKLDVQPGDIIINKGTGQTDGYSGFEGATDDGRTIEQFIRPTTPQERVAVLIGGLATDYCALNTVIDAAKEAARYQAQHLGTVAIYALRDTMRAVNLAPDDEAKAFAAMQAAGATLITTDEILQEEA